MLNKAINHMTTANASYASLLSLANDTGCIGVEIRNDLNAALFDGADAKSAGNLARSKGLRLLALSEVPAFNDQSDRAFDAVQHLAVIAKDCGAEAISLIPRNDGKGISANERINDLTETLIKFAPVLEANNILGYVEPLGFQQSSLRSKAEVVDVIEAHALTHRYKLVHDTFHHLLAGGGEVFPKHTGMVHVSGVTDRSVDVSQLLDRHRVLVNAEDVLGNIEQIDQLYSKGYSGPVSVEAFSPLVHELANPKAALSESFSYIESTVAAVSADTTR